MTTRAIQLGTESFWNGIILYLVFRWLLQIYSLFPKRTALVWKLSWRYTQAQGTFIAFWGTLYITAVMFWIMADHMRLGVLVYRPQMCGRGRLFDCCGLNQMRIKSAHSFISKTWWTCSHCNTSPGWVSAFHQVNQDTWHFYNAKEHLQISNYPSVTVHKLLSAPPQDTHAILNYMLHFFGDHETRCWYVGAPALCVPTPTEHPVTYLCSRWGFPHCNPHWQSFGWVQASYGSQQRGWATSCNVGVSDLVWLLLCSSRFLPMTAPFLAAFVLLVSD